VNLPETGRILALDLGQKRVGVALSDDLRITAQPYATLEPRGTDDLLESVRDIVAREQVALVLIGLPKRLDGSLGPMANEAKSLAALIRERLSLPVRMWDERFSTHAAERALLEDNVSRRKRKRVIDRTAAALILGLFGFAMIILELYGSMAMP